MKKYRITNTEQLFPTVSISIKGNKLKVYPNNTVYIKNGTEFELFFENPTEFNYKADIIINGEYERNSLVLNAGQRFRLDRFIDTDKKLLFDVYEVDNNEVVKDIIKDNGIIEVKFYKEFKYCSYTEGVIPQTYTATTTWFGNGTSNMPYCSNNSTITTANASVNYSQTLTSNNTQTLSTRSGRMNSKIETGRVEEGSKSNQQFVDVNMTFNYFPDISYSFKLLPYSQKPTGNLVTTNKIRSYCKCGRRVKQGDNYCRGCGRKL
jgi:hypothetical protein